MSTIDPHYEMPPPNTVEVACETFDVSGEIRSPTITQIRQSINDHASDQEKHRIPKVILLVTDGVSSSYTIIHSLNSNDLQVTFYDVTNIPQQLFFVHWEPITANAMRIVPDVVLQANRTIKIIIQ